MASSLKLLRSAAVGFIDWLGEVFGHSSTNKFFHKTGRKGFFGRKSNRAFSEIISSQLLAVCSNRVSTDVEGAVPLRSTEGNEQLRVKAVTRNAIAYALFGRWRCSLNVSPKLLKSGALHIVHTCETLIDGLGLGWHKRLTRRR